MPQTPIIEIRHPDFAAIAGQGDIFEYLKHLDGQVARKVENRETIRFELNHSAYYRKFHQGVGWREIIKNWVRLRAPILGAANEWHALNKLRDIGVDSLEAVAYGIRGKNPARLESFLVTKELSGTIKLHELLQNRDRYLQLSYAKRKSITQRVAEIAKAMHSAGINHRDFYFCHFLIDEKSLEEGSPIKIHLVDLHRAQIRKKVPTRWQVKDIASLHFSSLDLGVSSKEYLRFLSLYFDQPLRPLLASRLLNRISTRSQKLYEREQRLRARGLRP